MSRVARIVYKAPVASSNGQGEAVWLFSHLVEEAKGVAAIYITWRMMLAVFFSSPTRKIRSK